MYPFIDKLSFGPLLTQSVRILEWTPLTLKDRSIAPEVVKILEKFSDDIPGITNRSQELVEIIMWHASWYLSKHVSATKFDIHSKTDDIFTCTWREIFISVDKSTHKFILQESWEKEWRVLLNLD